MQHGAKGADSDLAGPGIDPHVPQSARVYDFLLGGKDNFAADRAVGSALIEQVPSLPVMVKANRAFLARAVRYLVGDAGIRQFLDIGTGIPTANNVHEVAQSISAETRVLYVDNDPVVLAHARALMTGSKAGKTAFIMADLREPEAILASPSLASTLDLDKPVALMLVGILHHLHEDDHPERIVETLLAGLPSGSYLSVTHPSADFDAAAMTALAATAEQSGIPYVPRSRAQIERLFEGLELVEPGVAPILGWRPDADTSPDVNSVYGWAAVGRKP
jgi:S-adenosyl methyltransferase